MPVTGAPGAVLLLTVEETSKELGIKSEQLREMRREGAGPRFTSLTRSTILYFRVEVLAWKGARVGSASG